MVTITKYALQLFYLSQRFHNIMVIIFMVDKLLRYKDKSEYIYIYTRLNLAEGIRLHNQSFL